VSKPFRKPLNKKAISQKFSAQKTTVPKPQLHKKPSQGFSRNPRGPRESDSSQVSTKHFRAVVGKHAIAEALKVSVKKIKLAYLRAGWESSQDLRELSDELKRLKIQNEVRPAGFFDQYYSSAQGAVLFIDGRPEMDMHALANKEKSILVILDGIEDPHNLGAILRSSWLMGIDAIVTTVEGSVGLSPAVHKVACGGVEHVPVIEVSNFNGLVNDLKKMGYWFFGLSHKAKNTLFNTRLQDKIVWVIGSEEKGLRSTTEKFCDELVAIPQVSASASYNASVAAAMALLETKRQQQ